MNEREKRLPKWAQRLITDLRNENRRMIGLMNAKLNDNQEQMESWHDHVIYENIFEGVGIPSGKRVINASSLTFLTASGVEVNVRASAEYVELGFGTNKSDTLALIEPRACNRIRIVPASARRYA